MLSARLQRLFELCPEEARRLTLEQKVPSNPDVLGTLEAGLQSTLAQLPETFENNEVQLADDRYHSSFEREVVLQCARLAKDLAHAGFSTPEQVAFLEEHARTFTAVLYSYRTGHTVPVFSCMDRESHEVTWVWGELKHAVLRTAGPEALAQVLLGRREAWTLVPTQKARDEKVEESDGYSPLTPHF